MADVEDDDDDHDVDTLFEGFDEIAWRCENNDLERVTSAASELHSFQDSLARL